MVNLGEAIQLSGKSVHVNSSQIEELKAIALQSDSLRARILAHPNSQSTVHEMLIVLHRDSLVLPHRHPLDKAESYLVLEGALRVDVVIKHTSGLHERVLHVFFGHVLAIPARRTTSAHLASSARTKAWYSAGE